MFRTAANSFSARLKDSFLMIACATGAGRLHDSSWGSVARKMPSGDSKRRSSRELRREAKPGVRVIASQEREESSCMALAGYVDGYRVVKWLQVNGECIG